MIETPYNSEEKLQELLAKYPNLLAGDQMDIEAPRRWLLVSREAPLPSEKDGAERWAIDHLFLDQDAIPTLVEIKRSSDTRIRREVVGQMLDYAANSVVYWSTETIRTQFEAQCEQDSSDPDTKLSAFLGADVAPEKFWQQAETNLRAGRIRLVFMADEIPAELLRIVEFLNEQMEQAAVFAVEIKQYVGEGVKTYVPRVVGKIPPTQPPPKQWDEASFLAELETKHDSRAVEVAEKILKWAQDRSLRILWGQGRVSGSFTPMLDYKETNHYLVSIWTYGRAMIHFGAMKAKPTFDDEQKRLDLLHRLNSVPGIAISEEGIGRFPSFLLSTLKDDASLKQFLSALDWAIGEIKK